MLMTVGSEDLSFGTDGALHDSTFFTATEIPRVWSERNECGTSLDLETPVPFTRWKNEKGDMEVEPWIVQGAGQTPNMSKAFDVANLVPGAPPGDTLQTRLRLLNSNAHLSNTRKISEWLWASCVGGRSPEDIASPGRARGTLSPGLRPGTHCKQGSAF